MVWGLKDSKVTWKPGCCLADLSGRCIEAMEWFALTMTDSYLNLFFQMCYSKSIFPSTTYMFLHLCMQQYVAT